MDRILLVWSGSSILKQVKWLGSSFLVAPHGGLLVADWVELPRSAAPVNEFFL